jgi:hypothetical protein
MIIADCPLCQHDFMYDPIQDGHLIKDDMCICQDCYDKKQKKKSLSVIKMVCFVYSKFVNKKLELE